MNEIAVKKTPTRRRRLFIFYLLCETLSYWALTEKEWKELLPWRRKFFSYETQQHIRIQNVNLASLASCLLGVKTK